MKKLLILFVVLDFIFIGVILKIFSEKERSIASLENEPALTDGQKQKLELIESFNFSFTDKEVVLSTDFLQSVCATYDLVELKFKAINVAFSGQPPLIINTYSCSEILKNPAQENLPTSLEDFKSMKKNTVLKTSQSQLRSFGIYSDEDMPSDWLLFEIAVMGDVSFNISEAELNSVLGAEAFKFNLTIF